FKRVQSVKLDAMLGLCETLHCRRTRLLDYFDQASQPCGNCDTCLNPPGAYDATVDVQKLLSTIYRVDQHFGAMHVLDVLRGIDSDKIRQRGHEQLSTFGIGSDRSEAEWRAILRQVIALGLVNVDHDTYGVLKLSDAARPVLKGAERVQLRVYRKLEKARRTSTRPKGFVETDLSAAQQAVFEKLRWWRMETARKHNVPAYVIFHDATMREIAKVQPHSLDDLRGVTGVGEKKLETYGAEIVALIVDSN
ncbi:MAG TPA: RQC domain-containing protein, partial [Oxalicibacterium sp.]|nr:RQC domain-containing protein [Oxalicibacterium sp.]